MASVLGCSFRKAAQSLLYLIVVSCVLLVCVSSERIRAHGREYEVNVVPHKGPFRRRIHETNPNHVFVNHGYRMDHHANHHHHHHHQQPQHQHHSHNGVHTVDIPVDSPISPPQILDFRVEHTNVGNTMHVRHKRAVTSVSIGPVSLDENVTTAQVANLASLPDISDASQRDYKLINTDPASAAGKLAVSLSGIVSLEGAFDFETTPTVAVIIHGTKRGAADDVANITLQINIQDVNEPPEFVTEPKPYLATLTQTAGADVVVITLLAVDPDRNANANLRYQIVSVNPSRYASRFVVRSSLKRIEPYGDVQECQVVTAGTDDFLPVDQEVTLRISAQGDQAADQVTTSVNVLFNVRAPQFYQTDYTGFISENSRVNQMVMLNDLETETLQIKVKKFQVNPVSFTLLDNLGSVSTAFSIDNDGYIRSLRTFDYDTAGSKEFELTIVARQTVGGNQLVSNASVTIRILDSNDNKPVFESSQYVATVKENRAVGTTVLTVTAIDSDSGLNAQVDYSLHSLPGSNDSAYFDVVTAQDQTRYVGHITIAHPLNFDTESRGVYSFKVLAVDRGATKQTSEASVRISTENVNDEAPQFLIDPGKVYKLQETATVGRVVAQIYAVDPDGDRVTYNFMGGVTTRDKFSITPNTGLITLVSAISEADDSFTLEIIAEDDGSCCGPAGQTVLSSNTTIIIQITDVNTHKPTFEDCTTYSSATVVEHSALGTSVLTVKAVDNDRGPNGEVIYSVTSSPSEIFQIGSSNGTITINADINRETTKFIQVTVKGTDQGDPVQLEGLCSFRIMVDDINDNAPTFESQAYVANITMDAQERQSIIVLKAQDLDVGQNAEIVYSLPVDGNGTFGISNVSGYVYLRKTLTQGVTVYNLVAMAKDKGNPPLNSTVPLTVNVKTGTSSPPQWDQDYNVRQYTVAENIQDNEVIIQNMGCNSMVKEPRVEFQLVDESGMGTQRTQFFKLRTVGLNRTDVLATGRFDYEEAQSHKVRIRCLNYGAVTLLTEVQPTVLLTDTNNKVPQFVGTNSFNRYDGNVAENQTAGQEVITIMARDDDLTPQFNTLTFRLKNESNPDFEAVNLGDNRVLIRTKRRLDREASPFYFVDVVVQDGAPSVLPGIAPYHNNATVSVLIKVTDVNDNPPYFNLSMYYISVDEDFYLNTPMQPPVAAGDLDDSDVGRLQYRILSSDANIQNTFGVRDGTGELFLRRRLDFENGDRTFTLRLQAFDGLYNAETSVNVTVLDVNDNAPVITPNPGTINNVVEEDDRYTPANRLLLLDMEATDADVDRNTSIEFFLMGYGTGDTQGPRFFEIDRTTGQLYLIGKLDRDPLTGGRENYVITVKATDEPVNPNIGYAEVSVRPLDINDNDPRFLDDKLERFVEEKSRQGTEVNPVVSATDPDQGDNGTVSFSLGRITNSQGAEMANYFTIDPVTGLIKTNVPADSLDRETMPLYYAVIILADGGSPSRSASNTMTIRLSDINDNAPVFEQQIYREEMSENLLPGVQVALVVATDADENPNLFYTASDTTFFRIDPINNEGSIQVYKQVDYEDPSQRFFNLTVTVQDGDPTHTATCLVQITVLDFNDNAPEITPQKRSVQVKENIPVGEWLGNFSATDRDSGFNAEFEFSIDRDSDRRRFFFINATTGAVHTRRSLDRETTPVHVLTILAIDKGSPPLTGTATLTVILEDINDNYPTFLEDYQPHVQENLPAVRREVQTILGYDPDLPPFGAPFLFREPECPSGCPCSARPSCQEFQFAFSQSGAGGNGSGLVTTTKSFDREQQKYYQIPIVMWDMGGSDSRMLSGTSTLTVTIADVNDSPMSPGHQDVFVYNYKGQFGPLTVGRVYVNDLDDWDLPDKTFRFVGPEWVASYFEIDPDLGNIIMKKGVPANTASNPYKFEVDVSDKVEQKTVRSTVSVVVHDLSEEAVMSSGAVRLSGTSAEDFIKKQSSGKSKFDQFRELMAQKLNVPVGNVEIISVQDVGEYTDVRYAAHGSPYYQSSQTDSVVVMNRNDFEGLGLNIAEVPIDMCAEEEFEGGCFNYMNITGQPNYVNSNGTSFVGVEVFIVAQEGCRALEYPGTTECTGDFCYNGGTCSKDDFGVLKCKCLEGFEGNRCQQLRHSFDGNSYAMYPTLEQCEDSQTSIEFITTQESGLILYNGPIANLVPDEPRDFIALELVGGYPVLHIDHGTGALQLSINGRDSSSNVVIPKLSDGKWHRIDILRQGRYVELIVDECKDAVTSGATTPDTTPCRATGETPGINSFLNVATLLQVGGRSFSPSYQANIGTAKFNGCVRNLRHNSKLYDLFYKPLPGQPSGQNGCPREDNICGNKCGANGICSADLSTQSVTCVCKPEWRGDRCETATTIRDLKLQSYFQWSLLSSFDKSSYQFDIQVMFRTRDRDGYLFTVRTESTTRSTTLEISEGRLQFLYDFGDGIQTLALTHAEVSNGQWHVARIRRVLQQVTLTLDEGEGRNYNFSRGNPAGSASITFSNTIYSGGVVSTPGVVDQDLTGTCMQDIRLNNIWFPMKIGENPITAEVNLVNSVEVSDNCIRNPVCVPPCTPPEVCHPLWDIAECRCGPGFHPVDGNCISDCLPNPCFNSVPCDINNGTVVCTCPDLWYGPLCQHYKDPADEDAFAAGLTSAAIAGIIVAIVVVIALVLVALGIAMYLSRKGSSDQDKMMVADDDDFDIRENVMFYDEEGAGEEDQDAYDLAKLPPAANETDLRPEKRPRTSVGKLGRSVPDTGSEVGPVLDRRLHDAEDDPDAPPYDTLHEFDDEGAGSTAGSLSSLNTSTSDGSQDYDYLNEWGPKFAKLADMYGAGQDESEDV